MRADVLAAFLASARQDSKEMQQVTQDIQEHMELLRSRIRDAVEAALADILLLGTEEHCRLAGQAAVDLAAGRPIHTAELVISLRSFIRSALDLGPMPADVVIPLQGPTRTQGGAGRGKGDADKGGNKGGGGGNGGGGIGMGIDTAHGTDAAPPRAT